jgi:hypothetical protein
VVRPEAALGAEIREVKGVSTWSQTVPLSFHAPNALLIDKLFTAAEGCVSG